MIEIDILYTEKLWEEYPLINQENINQVFEVAFKELSLGKKSQEIECSLVLTNDPDIKKYNKEYRGKDKPTNTLSFPVDGVTSDNIVNLGDIFISLDTIKKESSEHSKNFYDHFFHLLLHSSLHLIGYDHETDSDQQKMEGLEIKILKKLGIKNPYEQL